MSKHRHDIHYLLIVLILAFFVMTLSLRQVEPGVTGNFVRSADDSYSLVQFLKDSVSQPRIDALDMGVISPIDIPLVESGSTGKDANIGGKGYLGPSSPNTMGALPSSCEWVNIDNKNYEELKALTGHSACRTMAYKSCVATNRVLTDKYYASSDASCTGVQLESQSNEFGNCGETVRTYNTPCSTQTDGYAEPAKGDTDESAYTMVLCCD